MSSLLRVQNPHVRTTVLSVCGLELNGRGHLVPSASAQGTPVCFRSAASPLLEEKWDPGLSALLPDRLDPARVNWTRPMTRLPAHDDPVESFELKRQRPEQRFNGQEPE